MTNNALRDELLTALRNRLEEIKEMRRELPPDMLENVPKNAEEMIRELLRDLATTEDSDSS